MDQIQYPTPSVSEYDDIPAFRAMSDARLAERLSWHDARHWHLIDQIPNSDDSPLDDRLSVLIGINATMAEAVEAEQRRRPPSEWAARSLAPAH